MADERHDDTGVRRVQRRHLEVVSLEELRELRRREAEAALEKRHADEPESPGAA